MMLRRSVLATPIITLAVLCALFLSGAALNNLGLNYSVDASAGGFKLHPYTLLTVLAVALYVCGPQTCRASLSNRQFRTAMVGALVTCGILVLKAIVGDIGSLGFVVDTITAAFLLAAILPLVSLNVVTRVSGLLMIFLVIECLLAMIEVIVHVNLIPIDTWYGAYFRATALQGHPLNNALIVVTVATTLQAYIGRRLSVMVFFLTAGALIAFGARGALASYLFINVISFVRFGLGSMRRTLILLIGGVPVALGLSWLVLSGLIGDRIAQVGAFDDSSQVRVQSIELVSHLSGVELMFGSGQAAIVHLMNQSDIIVVENFLVGYLLTFGVVLTAVIFYCVYRTCKGMLSGVHPAGRRRLLAILFVFVCTALTNNSLATKTPALYLLVIGLWCARCRLLAAHGVFDATEAAGQHDPWVVPPSSLAETSHP